jgi:hypothetical protein
MFGYFFAAGSILATIFLTLTGHRVVMKHSPSHSTPVELSEQTAKPVKGLPTRRLQILYLVFGTIQTLVSYILYAHDDLFPIFGISIHLYLQTCVFVLLYRQFRFKKLKPFWYRMLLTWPASFYLGSTWFSLPLLLLIPVLSYFTMQARAIVAALSFMLGAIGMYNSLANPTFCGEEVCIDMTSDSEMKQPDKNDPFLHRVLAYKGTVHKERNLNIFQVTDPHLGPFMSVKRLEKICKNIVNGVKAGEIDLVFFTGDMETVETHDDDEALIQALEPLKEINCCYACLGNHDYENLNRIRNAMTQNGIIMLEDQECIINTRIGQVQIVGSIYTYAGEVGSHEHVKNLCKKYPKPAQVVARFMLIHNPSIFPHIPPEENVCVFSGHLVSFA